MKEGRLLDFRILATTEATRSALEVLVGGSESVRIAAAFVTQSGVGELRLLQRPIRRLQVLAGTDFGLTQVEALEAIDVPPNRECRLYYSPSETDEGIFHPKLYLGKTGKEFMAVLGSSNLTGPALTRNIELNVMFTGTIEEPVTRELDDFFLNLWETPSALRLTKDIINAYRVDQSARERLWRQVRHSAEFRQARDLVQRTLLGHFAGRPGRKWLLVTSEENYVRCLGRQRWGDENYQRINQIRPGDLLIFYIKRVHKLGAAAIATTPVYRSSEATWADREYPYRFDFVNLISPVAPIDFKPFIPQVSFLPRKDDKWGTALQTSSLELPDSDAQLLIKAIGAAQATPELHPAAAEPQEEYRTDTTRPV